MPDGPARAHSKSACSIVLATVMTHGSVTRSQLARITGLPRSTVNGAVQQLAEEGLISDVPPQPALDRRPRGRPAGRVQLRGGPRRIGVVALSHTHLRTAVLNLDGSVLARDLATPDSLEPSFSIIDHAEQALRRTMSALDAEVDGLDAVVLGIPAPFQRGKGVAGVSTMVERLHRQRSDAAAVPQWLMTDPTDELAARLRVPVASDNDANLGALGEVMFGAARGRDVSMYVKMVEGVGAGIAVKGKLLRGSSGLAGEIAHIQVDRAGPMCGCGRRGCLAAMLATTDLPAMINPTPKSPARLGDVFTLAAHGLAASERVLTEVSRVIGHILADVCLWLSPDIIVLDGLLGPVAPLVAATIQETVRLNAGPAFSDATEIVVSTLQDTAELLGGLALARKELLSVRESRTA